VLLVTPFDIPFYFSTIWVNDQHQNHRSVSGSQTFFVLSLYCFGVGVATYLDDKAIPFYYNLLLHCSVRALFSAGIVYGMAEGKSVYEKFLVCSSLC